MKIYILIMQRWGGYTGHSYVLGVYSDYFIAKMAGKMNNIYRGGKYNSRVITLETKESTLAKLDIYFHQEEKSSDKHSIEVRDKLTGDCSEGLNNFYLQKAKKEFEEFEVLNSVGLSDQEIIDLHNHLDSFNNEEKVFFRNWYLDYLNRENINS